MAEYIEREALKNNIRCTKEGLFFCGGKTYIDFDVVSKAVVETPTADVVEVVHGWWIEYGLKKPQCFMCKKFNYETSRFCPHCGARMDSERNVSE